MYNEFYRFTRKPFNITPNPEFLFLSDNHKEVFAHLLYGIRNHSGFIEVTGEVGTGKTTVLRTLLNQLDNEDYRLAFVFNPALSALELLQTINREYGVNSASSSRSELQTALNEFLLAENRAGRTVVLVIDEAQNLQAEVLEEIRLLSNLETETDKLVQIVLVGQPELAATLSRPDLRQLSQRITVRYHLKPMSAADTTEYINHRLRVAGHAGHELFEPRAIREIWRFSRGYPRLINVVCDRALLVGFAGESRRITAGMIRQAIAELGRENRAGGTGLVGRVLFAGCLLVALVLAGYLYLQRGAVPLPEQSTAPGQTSGAAELPVAAVVDPPAAIGWEELSAARRALSEIAGPATLKPAVEALFAEWAIADFELPRIDTIDQLRQASRTLDFDTLYFTGEFAGLQQINLPALLEFNLPGEAEPRFLTMTALDAEQARITPALDGRDSVPLELLKGLWTGRAHVLWKNHDQLGYLSAPGEAGPEVRVLQGLLQRAGYYPQPPSGIYDRQTLDSVTRFQAERGLVQDGRVGPLTLIHLYRASGLFRQPGLQSPAVTGGAS